MQEDNVFMTTHPPDQQKLWLAARCSGAAPTYFRFVYASFCISRYWLWIFVLLCYSFQTVVSGSCIYCIVDSICVWVSVCSLCSVLYVCMCNVFISWCVVSPCCVGFLFLCFVSLVCVSVCWVPLFVFMYAYCFHFFLCLCLVPLVCLPFSIYSIFLVWMVYTVVWSGTWWKCTDSLPSDMTFDTRLAYIHSSLHSEVADKYTHPSAITPSWCCNMCAVVKNEIMELKNI